MALQESQAGDYTDFEMTQIFKFPISYCHSERSEESLKTAKI
jgi:hypothetical protein